MFGRRLGSSWWRCRLWRTRPSLTEAENLFCGSHTIFWLILLPKARATNIAPIRKKLYRWILRFQILNLLCMWRKKTLGLKKKWTDEQRTNTVRTLYYSMPEWHHLPTSENDMKANWVNGPGWHPKSSGDTISTYVWKMKHIFGLSTCTCPPKDQFCSKVRSQPRLLTLDDLWRDSRQCQRSHVVIFWPVLWIMSPFQSMGTS